MARETEDVLEALALRTAQDAAQRLAHLAARGRSLDPDRAEALPAVLAVAELLALRVLQEIDSRAARATVAKALRRKVHTRLVGFILRDLSRPTRTSRVEGTPTRPYLALSFAAGRSQGRLPPTVLLALREVQTPTEAEHLASWLFGPSHHRTIELSDEEGLALERRIARRLGTPEAPPPHEDDLSRAARELLRYLRRRLEGEDQA